MSRSISAVSSGVEDLDRLLNGGYIQGRLYLLRGRPGTGKTLLGMHFLEAGLEKNEQVLFIHGEESKAEIQANAAQFDIDVSGAAFLDLGPDSEFFTEGQTFDLVGPSDAGEDHTDRIHDRIEEIDPKRIVIDPLTQLRYVEANEYEFRKRILSFMRFLKGRGTTVLSTATPAADAQFDTEMQSLADGIVELSRGNHGRRVQVTKHRGHGQVEGDHGLEIRADGLEVYPSLIPEARNREFDPVQIGTGIEAFDDLVGGGIEAGTVTIISGPTGSGKTTTGTLFTAEAAREGLRSTIYLFEENYETFSYRMDSLGIPIEEFREAGLVSVREIEPLAMSAEEFAAVVREDIAETGTDLVMIDGIDGYTMSIQGDRGDLVKKLHALARRLKHQDVTVFVTDETSEITGMRAPTSSNISYISDNILFLSYLELDGSLRKVVGALKKRAGDFEHTLREFAITGDGVHVGEPLSNVSGVIDGTHYGDEPPR